MRTNQSFGFSNQTITKGESPLRIVLSDKSDDLTKGRRELVQSGLLRNPRLHLVLDFLKSENSALFGCLDTFVDRSH